MTTEALGMLRREWGNFQNILHSVTHPGSPASPLHVSLNPSNSCFLTLQNRVFMFSSPVSPISSHLCHLPFFFCPTHPLLLTPELSPLKNPGNKTVVPGLFIAASVSTPLIHAGQIGPKRFSTSIFYVWILFPQFFFCCCSSSLCTVSCAHSGSAVPEKTHTNTHVCVHMYMHSHRHTAGLQLHTKAGVWKSMKEKEEKGERSLNKLALEKRRKTRKRVMETETKSNFL